MLRLFVASLSLSRRRGTPPQRPCPPLSAFRLRLAVPVGVHGFGLPPSPPCAPSGGLHHRPCTTTRPNVAHEFGIISATPHEHHRSCPRSSAALRPGSALGPSVSTCVCGCWSRCAYLPVCWFAYSLFKLHICLFALLCGLPRAIIPPSGCAVGRPVAGRCRSVCSSSPGGPSPFSLHRLLFVTTAPS